MSWYVWMGLLEIFLGMLLSVRFLMPRRISRPGPEVKQVQLWERRPQQGTGMCLEAELWDSRLCSTAGPFPWCGSTGSLPYWSGRQPFSDLGARSPHRCTNPAPLLSGSIPGLESCSRTFGSLDARIALSASFDPERCDVSSCGFHVMAGCATLLERAGGKCSPRV